MAKGKKLFEYRAGNTLPFGVMKVTGGVQFAVHLPKHNNMFLNLYKKGKKNPDCQIALTEKFRMGGGYFVVVCKAEEAEDSRSIEEILSQDYEYLYEVDGKEFVDPYAGYVTGREQWGKRVPQTHPVRGGISIEEFDWKGDVPLRIPYSDLILYQLHVRGYTKHVSSKVKHKGTFRGLMEKIPYMKDLGINGVVLLPSYEFCEVEADDSVIRMDTNAGTARTDRQITDHKVNYWGYGAKETFYFAPKAAYCSHQKSPSAEFKEMVQAFHYNGIEVILDIYFTPGTKIFLMTDCLRSWALKYHVDGFRVNQNVMPLLNVASDPILSDVKMLASYWDMNMLHNAGVSGQKNGMGEYNEGFMNDARRFLKGDEGMVEKVVRYFSRNYDEYSVVNFITHVNGFTMMDLVSYDVKHNQGNGEMNRDGTEYNYSWNCGTEGRTKKKSILDRRMVQIRNAFLMLLTSQGTPMILAGDELGNSQSGNNNAYCQDNAITWINWNMTKMAVEIHEFVKKIILLRKSFQVLHQNHQIRMMDTLSCGMPDLSIHGVQAWRPDYSNYSRMLGMLYYGEYVEERKGRSVYIIYNMYWQAKSFDLPNLPYGRAWRVIVDSYANTFDDSLLKIKKKPVSKRSKKGKRQAELQKKTVVPPRSVVIFVEI